MAENELKSHIDWFTWETLIRQNMPQHTLDNLAKHPTKLVRTKESKDDAVVEFLQTIDKLREENDELKRQNNAKDSKIHELTNEFEPIKEALLLKISVLSEKLQSLSPDEYLEIFEEAEISRIRHRTQAETLRKLETNLNDYRQRIFELERELKNLAEELSNKQPIPIDLRGILELAKQNSEVLTAKTPLSEDNIDKLLTHLKTNKQPLEDLIIERTRLKPVENLERYIPQEFAEDIKNHLNYALKINLLLEKHEIFKKIQIEKLKSFTAENIPAVNTEEFEDIEEITTTFVRKKQPATQTTKGGPEDSKESIEDIAEIGSTSKIMKKKQPQIRSAKQEPKESEPARSESEEISDTEPEEISLPNQNLKKSLTQDDKQTEISSEKEVIMMLKPVQENLNQLLEKAEGVLIDAFHKLHINDEKIKSLLQALIDQRKKFKDVIEKPVESLILKQEFCGRQMAVITELVNSADNLTNLIESFEGIEQSQIEIQQISQSNLDGLKEFFNKKPERKKFERKKTYLSVSHAEPSSSREGLDVLKDLLSSIKRNQNIINELENSKQKLLNDSDLGQDANVALQALTEDINVERQILKKTFDTLLSIEENQGLSPKCDEVLGQLDAVHSNPKNQLEIIKNYLSLTLKLAPLKITQVELLNKLVDNMDKDHGNYLNQFNKFNFNENEHVLELDRLRKENKTKNDEINHLNRVLDKFAADKTETSEEINDKLKQATDTQSIADSLQEQLKNHETEFLNIANRIGGVLIKTDMLGDSLINMLPDNKLKQEMDDYQLSFENIMKKITETNKAPVEDLIRLLDLLSNYESANAIQASRLSSAQENDIVEDIVVKTESNKLKPPPKSKVRSSRPTDSTLETIDKATNYILQDAGTVLYISQPDDPIFEEAKKSLNEPDLNLATAILDKLKITRNIIKKIEGYARNAPQAYESYTEEIEESVEIQRKTNTIKSNNPALRSGKPAEKVSQVEEDVAQVITNLNTQVEAQREENAALQAQISLIKNESIPQKDYTNQIADLEELTNETVRKAVKETSNLIHSNDQSSKKSLDEIKREAQDISENPSPSIDTKLDNISRNQRIIDKIESLRKRLQQEAQRQLTSLKTDLLNKENELIEAQKNLENKVKDLELKNKALENGLKEREALVNKLAKDQADKEVELSRLRNEINDLTQTVENSKEEYNRLEEENSDNSKSLRNMRKLIKEKEEEINNLNSRIDSLEKTDRNSAGSDETMVNQLRKDIKDIKIALASKNKEFDQLANDFSRQKRECEIHLKDCQAHLSQIQSQKEEISQLKLKIMDLDTKNNELQDRNRLGVALKGENEIDDLLKELESKDQQIRQLRDQIDPLVKYRKMYSIMKTDQEQEQQEKDEKDIDISELIRRIRALTNENEQLKYKTRLIEKYQRDYLSIGQENSRLSKKLDYFGEFLDKEGNADLKSMSNKLTTELSEKMGEINELKEKIDALVIDVKRIQQSRENTLKRQIILRLLQLARMGTSLRFNQWKIVAEEPSNELKEDPEIVAKLTVIIPAKINRKFVGINADDSALEKQSEDIITEESDKLLSKNPIVSLYKRNAVRSQNPMDKTNLTHIFEDMIESKYDFDIKDINNGRIPKGIPDYFIEYLISLYGNKKKMLIYLSQFLPGLKLVYDEQDKTAILISRLLQINDASPVLNDDSSAIVKIFKETKDLLKNDKTDDVSIEDAVSYVNQKFENDHETGQLILDVINADPKLTRAGLILTIIDASQEIRIKDIAWSLSLLKKPTLTQSDFNELITSLKPDINNSQLLSMWDIGLMWSKDPENGVSGDSFYKILKKYQIDRFNRRVSVLHIVIVEKTIRRTQIEETKEIVEVVSPTVRSPKSTTRSSTLKTSERTEVITIESTNEEEEEEVKKTIKRRVIKKRSNK